MIPDKKELKNLQKRYLVWLYKTNKEALDRIERKFTQLEVDNSILEDLKKHESNKALKGFIDEFREYIRKKEQDGMALKYENKALKPQYQFLVLKLEAIQKSIVRNYGKKFLEEVKLLYEMEMTERILKSTEH